jgi:hypothetical protein
MFQFSFGFLDSVPLLPSSPFAPLAPFRLILLIPLLAQDALGKFTRKVLN